MSRFSVYVDIDPEIETIAMAERVRARHRRREPHTSEDVMALEPDMDIGAGPHMTRIFYPQNDYKYSDGEGSEPEDDTQKLIPKTTVDPNASWLKRTHDAFRGDISSILLLLFLYLLQGIPLGLIGAIPLVLVDKKVSFGGQATFSFAYYPFSSKLLWAPIVDSVYSRKFGRRKSWMIPCQYLIGIFMLLLSFRMPQIMGEEGEQPDILFLMLVFLPLNFLAATQDIAVDGWALTMLSRRNVGYASTCNAVGQTIGYFLGNIVFLTLQSADFCNAFRSAANQSDQGFVDLAGYLFFWGWVFVITTTLVMIFKREIDMSLDKNNKALENGSIGSIDQQQPAETKEGEDEEEIELSMIETYKVLWKILCLKPMLYMIVILITGKVAFAATDSLTSLKLISMGMKKERLASISFFLTPLQVFLPWMIGKWTSGPRPLTIFLMAYPYRIFIGGIFAALLFFTPHLTTADGQFGKLAFFSWLVAYVFQQIATYSMFVSMMAFCAQISDPRIGGTYMTLLNTLNNLGGVWPQTFILSITDWFTFKNCVVKGTKTILYSCAKKELADQCTAGGDVCEMAIDGYYVAVAVCTVIGIIWYKFLFGRVRYLQKIPRSQWKVIKSK